MWSTASYALALTCQPSLSKEGKKKERKKFLTYLLMTHTHPPNSSFLLKRKMKETNSMWTHGRLLTCKRHAQLRSGVLAIWVSSPSLVLQFGLKTSQISPARNLLRACALALSPPIFLRFFLQILELCSVSSVGSGRRWNDS